MLDSKRGCGGRDALNKTEEGKENTNQHNCCCGGYYHLPVKNLISVNVFQKDFFFLFSEKKNLLPTLTFFLLGCMLLKYTSLNQKKEF